MTRAYPPCCDWNAIAAAAGRLLQARLASDRAAVDAGKLDAARADTRERVARSLVTMWRAIAQHADIPALPATDAEIRDDLAGALAATERRARDYPNDAMLQAQWALVEAMALYHAPWCEGSDTPRIVFCHGINQELRARRAATDSSSPGGHHVDRSAERAPSATAGRAAPSTARPAQTLPGLL